MEIRELRLLVTETDLNGFLGRCSFPDVIRDLRIAVLPEGIRVRGIYRTVIGIPFEMLWQVSAAEGTVIARLGSLKAGFLPLGLLKSYFLGAVAGVAELVELRNDTLVIDVDRLLQDRGLPLRANLTAIRCADGSLTVESRSRGAGETA